MNKVDSRCWMTASQVLAMTISIALWAVPAQAVPINISACGAYSANGVLVQDVIDTSSGPSGSCISMGVGYDLDLDGYGVICNVSTGCGTAIEVAGTGGSHVENGSIEAGTGTWAVGVSGARFIANMSISGVSTGIYDLGQDRVRHIDNNTIDATNWAINVHMDKSEYDITGNIIAGENGIRIYGRADGSTGRGPKVEQNQISIRGTGIEQWDSTRKIRFLDNEISEASGATAYDPCVVDSPDLYGETNVWTGNTCSPVDPDTGDAACCALP